MTTSDESMWSKNSEIELGDRCRFLKATIITTGDGVKQMSWVGDTIPDNLVLTYQGEFKIFPPV